MSNIAQIDFTIQLANGKYTIIRLVGGSNRWLLHGKPWEAGTREFAHAAAINALIDRVHELECAVVGVGLK